LWSRVIKNTILGVVEGLLYYIVYFKLLPLIFSSALGVPIEPPPLLALLLLGVFIALGVISTSVKPFIGLVFEALSSTLGALILVVVIGEKLTTSTEYSGVVAEISFEFKPLLLVIIGFSVLYAIVRCFERLSQLAEE
jgi:predicted tellurium resistance membrane protein TerC